MAFPTTTRSGLVYQAPRVFSIESTGPKLAELIQSRIDSFVEYPGSIKGEFGEWRLVDWASAKIERVLSRGGTERK